MALGDETFRILLPSKLVRRREIDAMPSSSSSFSVRMAHSSD